MITRAEEAIRRGSVHNSMYESNTVRGSATEADMQAYYAKESSLLVDRPPMKPNAMKVVKFGEVDLTQLKPIIIK